MFGFDYADNLGVLYRNGKGVSQDYKEAVKWYRKAANQGFEFAQMKLDMLKKKIPKELKKRNENIARLKKTKSCPKCYITFWRKVFSLYQVL